MYHQLLISTRNYDYPIATFGSLSQSGDAANSYFQGKTRTYGIFFERHQGKTEKHASYTIIPSTPKSPKQLGNRFSSTPRWCFSRFTSSDWGKQPPDPGVRWWVCQECRDTQLRSFFGTLSDGSLNPSRAFSMNNALCSIHDPWSIIIQLFVDRSDSFWSISFWTIRTHLHASIYWIWQQIEFPAWEAISPASPCEAPTFQTSLMGWDFSIAFCIYGGVTRQYGILSSP